MDFLILKQSVEARKRERREKERKEKGERREKGGEGKIERKGGEKCTLNNDLRS